MHLTRDTPTRVSGSKYLFSSVRQYTANQWVQSSAEVFLLGEWNARLDERHHTATYASPRVSLLNARYGPTVTWTVFPET